jgi:hypothetical protein
MITGRCEACSLRRFNGIRDSSDDRMAGYKASKNNTDYTGWIAKRSNGHGLHGKDLMRFARSAFSLSVFSVFIRGYFCLLRVTDTTPTTSICRDQHTASKQAISTADARRCTLIVAAPPGAPEHGDCRSLPSGLTRGSLRSSQ